MRVGFQEIFPVSPSALCRGSSGVCDLRWSRIVCPSDFFLRYGVLRSVGIQKRTKTVRF